MSLSPEPESWAEARHWKLVGAGIRPRLGAPAEAIDVQGRVCPGPRRCWWGGAVSSQREGWACRPQTRGVHLGKRVWRSPSTDS